MLVGDYVPLACVRMLCCRVMIEERRRKVLGFWSRFIQASVTVPSNTSFLSKWLSCVHLSFPTLFHLAPFPCAHYIEVLGKIYRTSGFLSLLLIVDSLTQEIVSGKNPTHLGRSVFL